MDPYGISESAMLEAAQLSALETQERWEKSEANGDNRGASHAAGRRSRAAAKGQDATESKEFTATRLPNGKVRSCS